MTVYKLLLKLMQGIRSLALAIYPTQDNNPPLTIMNKIFLAVLVFGFAMASAAPSNADTKLGECNNDYDCDYSHGERCSIDGNGFGICEHILRINDGERKRCSWDTDCPGPLCCQQGSCVHFMYC